MVGVPRETVQHLNLSTLANCHVLAGLRMEDIVGSQTSCYVGSFTKDYSEIT
jgi:hypothetical protein